MIKLGLAVVLVLVLAVVASNVEVLDEYRQANWFDGLTLYQEVHGPGILVDGLPLSDDEEFEASVQEVLDSFKYDQHYTEDVFDCTNTSQITWKVLRDHGFDAKLMYCNSDVTGRKGIDAHSWVVVPKNRYHWRYGSKDYENWVIFGADGWIQVESTYNFDGPGKSSTSLGEALTKREAGIAYSRGVGWMFNTSTEYEFMTGEGLDIMIAKDMHIVEAKNEG